MERLNIEALAALTGKHGVKLAAFPKDLIGAARRQSVDVMATMAATGSMAGKIHKSYAGFRDRTAEWSRISIQGVLESREG